MSSRSKEGITCLPLNTYSNVQSDQQRGLVVEAGILQQDGSLLVAQQVFTNGRCSSMTLGTESSKL